MANRALKNLAIKTYRLVPEGLRRSVSRTGPFSWVRQRMFEADSSLHDTYYTEEYYEQDVIGPAAQSAPFMADDMIRHFAPADVVDVGCGSGDYLAAFRDRGVLGHGIELAEAALRLCQAKGLDVIKFDLSTAAELPWKADLVYSFEVAEHISPASAARFVEALTGSARKHVCLTAAAPGQDGLCHVNCQPKPYWINLFRGRGFTHDEGLTESWQQANQARSLAGWLCHNLMVFHAPGVSTKSL
jgi:SAM-dependent methyltransferase